jgi:hypothetical protein
VFDRHSLGLRFRGILIVALGCRFVSFQAKVVALYAPGGDCSGGSERGVCWLPFLKAAEFAGCVEFYWVAVLALKFGERCLALFGSVESGDDGPSRERRRLFDLVRDFGGIRRHHQIPADQGQRCEVGASPVNHAAIYSELSIKSHRGSGCLCECLTAEFTLDRFFKFGDDQKRRVIREHQHVGASGFVDSDRGSDARRRSDWVGLQLQLAHRGGIADRRPLSIGNAWLVFLENEQHGLCRCDWESDRVV